MHRIVCIKKITVLVSAIKIIKNVYSKTDIYVHTFLTNTVVYKDEASGVRLPLFTLLGKRPNCNYAVYDDRVTFLTTIA